jgi:hypothetical protein
MLSHKLRMAVGNSSGIRFVAAGTVARGSNPTATLPSGWQSGDVFIMVGSSNANFTTPTGWTSIVNSTTAPRIFLCWKVAGSSESNVAVTTSGSGTSVCILAYRNTNASPIDVSSTATIVSSANTVTAPSVTTLTNNARVLRFACAGSQSESFTGFSSTDTLTTRLNFAGLAGGGNALAVVDSLKVTAGATATVTATLSGGATNNMAAITVALKSA